MRDVRTRGETALHRAAVFAAEDRIQLLRDAGAKIVNCLIDCEADRTAAGSSSRCDGNWASDGSARH